MLSIGVIIGIALVFLISYALFLSIDVAFWAGWVVFGFGVVAGALLGFLLYKKPMPGVFLMGGCGGAVLALVLYNAALAYFQSEVINGKK